MLPLEYAKSKTQPAYRIMKQQKDFITGVWKSAQ